MTGIKLSIHYHAYSLQSCMLIRQKLDKEWHKHMELVQRSILTKVHQNSPKASSGFLPIPKILFTSFNIYTVYIIAAVGKTGLIILVTLPFFFPQILDCSI